jgi:hypothetical protein
MSNTSALDLFDKTTSGRRFIRDGGVDVIVNRTNPGTWDVRHGDGAGGSEVNIVPRRLISWPLRFR